MNGNIVPFGKPPNSVVRELYYWARGGQTNFTSMLFDLIAKADDVNLAKIRRGFPSEVLAWEKWHQAENPLEFFQSHGVRITEDIGG